MIGILATSKSNRSANVQEKTLEEARESLQEAIALILISNRQLAEQQLSDKEVIREKITVKISVKRRKLIRYLEDNGCLFLLLRWKAYHLLQSIK
jgi:hypothetical protein